MRQIGTIARESDARRLADYLLTQKIDTRLEQEADAWAVWVCDEDRVPQARKELEAFTRNPDDPRYRDAAPVAQALRQEEVQAEKKYRKNLIDVRQRWGDPSLRNWPLTLVLILVSVAVYLAPSLGYSKQEIRNWLYIASYWPVGHDLIGWNGLDQVRQGQVWRLVTPIFIHFGVLHILFNMMWLYDLGRMIEFRRGTLRFGLMVLVIAVASNLAQYLASGPAFGGMSGVVFGLFGYVWMKSRFDPDSGMYMHPNNVVLMLVWFVICLTGWVGPIANWAHGVGLAVGVLIGVAPFVWQQLTNRD